MSRIYCERCHTEFDIHDPNSRASCPFCMESGTLDYNIDRSTGFDAVLRLLK